MYERIVVGTDGSPGAQAAVEHAATLARTTGAELHVVQGCGSPVAIASPHGVGVDVDPCEVEKACRGALAPDTERLRSSGLTVETHVVSKTGADAVCSVAEDVRADLIIVGNRGMTGARRLLGSVPNSIAHQAPCSVLIVATKA